MNRTYCTLIFLTITINCFAQQLRTSLLQYQMNALALNPAYSSYVEASGFEATYLGNFISQGAISRSVLVNMQGATEKGGLGLTFNFYRNFQGEVNLRPSFSRRLMLENGGMMAFGLVIGLNYFDAPNDFFTDITDFVSADGGFGVYYSRDRFFAGISVLSLLEKTAGLDPSAPGPERENPYNFHAGGLFDLTNDIMLKPVILARYINTYVLPDVSFQNVDSAFSLDLQLNAIIEGSYMVGILYGFTDSDIRNGLQRFGISATYMLDQFRLTYAFQNNNETNNSVSLPVTHLISAGYDIGGSELETPRRFF
ncbi:MAG: type IX secretion system membrane protein PorP/SprF [Bacteroidota bacterium]